MNLQWILLALFLMAVVSNVFRAMRNPMLKNVLRLISIPIAFVITYLLQVNGVFQLGIQKLLSWVMDSYVPKEYVEILGDALGLIIPFLCTVLGAFIFSLVFNIVLLLLKILHVNLTYKYVMSRKQKKEIEKFRASLEEEKERVKKSIRESEEKRLAALEVGGEEISEQPEFEYKSLDDDEIERLVEERVREEKKKKKKAGFFKESGDHKSISILAGIVSGFLLFGISWMGFFYSMDILSEFTAGIKNTEADEGKIYRVVELVDKYAVTPYEESFVYELYSSMGVVDLMNQTVRAGGKIVAPDGTETYADDIMRKYTRHSVRLACELTDTNIVNSNLGEDIEALTKDPAMVSFMAKGIVFAVEKFEESNPDFFESLMAPAPEGEINITGLLLGNVIKAYKNEDGSWSDTSVKNDFNAIIDVVVLAADNKLLTNIISNSVNWDAVLADRDLIKSFAGKLSGVSFYAPLMESAFTLSIDMMAPVLGLPANNAEAYEAFVNKITSSVQSVNKLSDEDLQKLHNLFINADQYRVNEGKIEYLEGKIERNNGKISENNALIAEKEALLNAPETSEEDKSLLTKEIEDLKEDVVELQTEILEVQNDQLAPLYEEREKAELANEKTSILDYLLDPIYVIDIIKDDGLKLKESGDALIEESKQLEAEASDLNTRANELLEKSQELADLQNNITNLNEAQILRLQELIEEQRILAETGHDFVSESNRLAADGQALADKADDLFDRGNKLLDDGRALADSAAKVMDDFQSTFEGFSPFVTYFMTWMSVQKPFMLAGEDTSTACMAIYIGDELYICNTDILNLKSLLEVVKDFTSLDPNLGGDILNPDNSDDGNGGGEDVGSGDGSEGSGGAADGENPEEVLDKLDEFLKVDIDEIIEKIPSKLRELLDQLRVTNDTGDMTDSVSELTELVDYLIKQSHKPDVVINDEWLIPALGEYINVAKVDASKKMAEKIVNANEDHSTFDYLGVTAEHMYETLCFGDEWTAEAKEKDTKTLIDIIFTMIDMIKNMSGEGEEAVEMALELGDFDTSQVDSILSLLVTLGQTMDKMAETTCLHGLPHVLLESILKNEMLSVAMTPTMLYGENGYMSRIDKGDLNYESFMQELVDTVKDLLDAMSDKEEEV